MLAVSPPVRMCGGEDDCGEKAQVSFGGSHLCELMIDFLELKARQDLD